MLGKTAISTGMQSLLLLINYLPIKARHKGDICQLNFQVKIYLCNLEGNINIESRHCFFPLPLEVSGTILVNKIKKERDNPQGTRLLKKN